MTSRSLPLGLVLVLFASWRALGVDDTFVTFQTSFGNIDVQLLSDEAPQTVANFLNYVDRGAYANSIIHRIATPARDGVSVIQGGGFYNSAWPPLAIATTPPVTNEFRVSNTMETLAMAKLGNNPNSATSQWFFNVTDNTALDGINGGFTVFGRIVNADSLAVMSQIASVPTFSDGGVNDGGALTEIPLRNYAVSTSGAPSSQYYVNITSITRLPVEFSTWQSAAFGSSSLDTSPAGTNFNDRVPNLTKYICHIDPTRPMTGADVIKLPKIGSIKSGNNLLTTLTFHQYACLPAGSLSLQTSRDMQNWTTVDQPTIVQVGTDASTRDPILQFQVPSTPGVPQFLRLVVSAKDPVQ